MHFLSAWVGEEFWKTVVSHTLSSHGWFQRQVFTAVWSNWESAICNIMLILIYKNLQCLCTAPFVLSVPLLSPACWLTVEHPLPPQEDISAKLAHTPSLPFLQKDPEHFVVKWSHPSLQLSVTYIDTIGSSQSTPLRSIGTKMSFFFHSSLWQTQ